MGASVSSPVGTLQWLLSESAKILETSSVVVSMTSAVVTNYRTNFKDRADAQISMVFTDVEDFLSELSSHGELAQQCADSKKETLITLRNKLITELVECYQSHDKIFVRLQKGREALHVEALRIKADAEELVSKCSSDMETRFTCLSQGLSRLRRQVRRLMKQVETHARRELSERRKVLLSLVKCDHRAVKRAYRTVQKIIYDVRECIFSNPSPALPYNAQPE